MSIGTAIDLVKMGYQVSREAWDNVEVYVYLDHTGTYDNTPLLTLHNDDIEQSFCAVVTTDDLLANDWYLLA